MIKKQRTCHEAFCFIQHDLPFLLHLVEAILPQECNFTGNAPLTSGVVTAANLGAIARDLEPGKEEEEASLCHVCVCAGCTVHCFGRIYVFIHDHSRIYNVFVYTTLYYTL